MRNHSLTFAGPWSPSECVSPPTSRLSGSQRSGEPRTASRTPLLVFDRTVDLNQSRLRYQVAIPRTVAGWGLTKVNRNYLGVIQTGTDLVVIAVPVRVSMRITFRRSQEMPAKSSQRINQTIQFDPNQIDYLEYQKTAVKRHTRSFIGLGTIVRAAVQACANAKVDLSACETEQSVCALLTEKLGGSR